MNPFRSAAVAAVTVAALLTSGAIALAAPAAAPADDSSCAWRQTAVLVLGELAGDTGPRATRLRQLLADSGVGRPGFLPERCRTGGTTAPDRNGDPTGPATGTAPGDPTGPATGTGPGNAANGDPERPGAGAPAGTGHCPRTAAAAMDWGTPNRADEFNGSKPSSGWSLYDGPGHAGNGRRTPSAVSVADGALTITGTPGGDAEGMAWNPGQKYGRWELCVRSPRTASKNMHSLSLLWPDGEANSPDEVDFMEIGDPTRQSVEMFLHHPGGQDHGELTIDATQWHAFAVDWTPQGITNYVDGRPWWHTTDASHLPRGPMHMTIQLDYFGGGAAEATEDVDWAHQYSPAGGPGSESGAPEGGSPGSGNGESS